MIVSIYFALDRVGRDHQGILETLYAAPDEFMDLLRKIKKTPTTVD